MADNEESLQRLEAWLSCQSVPPTLFDVLRTGDVDLFSAYILKGFRGAAAKAVEERERVTVARSAVLKTFEGDAERAENFLRAKHPLLGGATPLEKVAQSEAGAAQVVRLAQLDIPGAALRALEGISRAWGLSREDEALLLGVSEEQVRAWLEQPPVTLPAEVLERVSNLLSIFRNINMLLPEPARADAWIRAPNAAQVFVGRSALEAMMDNGIEGLRRVREYLEKQR
jgi:hypothetical protein